MTLQHAANQPKPFDPELYVKILVAIAKADRENGPREFDFVRKQAQRLGVDFDQVWQVTEKTLAINKQSVPRSTALAVLKDCIRLATLDRSFSLGEKEKIYTYAEKLDVPRTDVDRLEEWIGEFRTLKEKWRQLVAPR